jgi:hypothetical protein
VTDETDRELVPFLERAVGDGLRAAGVTTDDGYEILFVRDDVVEKLAADGDFRAAADEIADELVFRELEREYQRRLFGLGDRRCSVEVFDDGVVFLFPEDLEAKRGRARLGGPRRRRVGAVVRRGVPGAAAVGLTRRPGSVEPRAAVRALVVDRRYLGVAFGAELQVAGGVAHAT